MERQVRLDLNCDELYARCPINTKEVYVPLAAPPDRIETTSLMKFLMKYNKNIMVIYDALLSEKRIIFAGALDTPTSQI